MVTLYYLERLRGNRLRETSLLRYWATLILPILAMLAPLAFKRVAYGYLALRGTALYVATFSGDLAFLLAVIVVILQGSSRIGDSVVVLREKRPQRIDAYLVRIACRVLGIVAAVIVFLEGGKYLGFPVTTLLAGAGISGLAIALAAQSLIKGLFGTVTVLFDKPYQTGERIIVKGHDGVVEEIGMRATKLRLLTGHLVSIPNDQMADSEIENVGRRSHIRRLADLRIPVDTPREKVEKAVEVIRSELKDHEGMDPDFPPRVYFVDFGPDCYTIRVIYWYTPPEYWDFLAFSERLNFHIFRAFEEQGIQLSLPTRVSYWAADSEQGPLEVKVCEQESSKLERSRQ
jgi:MscS family membrane protein